MRRINKPFFYNRKVNKKFCDNVMCGDYATGIYDKYCETHLKMYNKMIEEWRSRNGKM